MSPIRPVVIIGAGGHATACANVALSAGIAIAGFVDPGRDGESHCGRPVRGSATHFGDPSRHLYFVAVGDNFARRRLHLHWEEQMGRLDWATLVHASAVIGEGACLGPGSVVMALSQIGPNCRIGSFCIINSTASIDHDGRMADYASLAPGVVTGGTVTIGERSAIGIGAVLRHNISVGSDSLVGGNAYLDQDLPSQVVAYGSPARVVRTHEPGKPYL